MVSFLFYLFSGGALLTAVFVITHPKPTRALMALIATMLCLAVLYVLLGAPFVAMVHLIVYAGAVLVLFLFVIMLQGIQARDIPLLQRFHFSYIAASFAVVLLFLTALTYLLKKSDVGSFQGIMASVEAVAQALFSRFLLPFELVSILVLVGIFAAVSLAKDADSSLRGNDKRSS